MSEFSNNLCRACLIQKESFRFFLFDHVSAETYAFCTSIEVKDDETLPRTLCDACFNLINNYSHFKRVCIDSQHTLEIYSKKIKVEEPIFENGSTQFVSEVIAVQNEEVESDFEAKFETDILSVKDECYSEPFDDGNIKNGGTQKHFVSDIVALKNEVEESGLEAEETDTLGVKKECYSEHFDDDFLLQEYFEKDTAHSKKKKKSKKKDIIKGDITEESRNLTNYACDMCGKTFKYSKRLETHKKVHFVNDGSDNDYEPSIHCKKCNKTFVTMSGLRRHEESTHTSVALSSVRCAHCGRVCASRHSLRAHEKTHARNTGHAVCHVCGKRVSSQAILRVHLETHTTDRERRHTCEHCGKKFFTNAILLSHIKRIHSGLRYICGVCGFPFNDKHNLTKHLLIHEGKKMYTCDICNKSYSTNGTLVEHRRIHSGERPFSCNFCPKSFLSNRRLKDHHKTHTGEKPHKCSICGERFTQRGTLKRHMKVHDPTKTPPNVMRVPPQNDPKK